MPIFYLARVEPNSGEGADVFGYPDKEGDEYHGEEERHRATHFVHTVVHFCFPENKEYVCKEEIADVEDIVVREEVGVDEGREDPEVVVGGEVFIPESEEDECAGNVAPDGGVEEARKKRHRGEYEHGTLGARIAPRANGGVRLEELHAGGKCMEEKNDKKFSQTFEPKDERAYLKQNGGEEDEIVSVDEWGSEELCKQKNA